MLKVLWSKEDSQNSYSKVGLPSSNNPRVSVIVPVFNDGEHISACINSVLSQSLRDIEIIVIDGQSTDNTLAELSSFTDDRIRTVSEQDDGIYDAMNKGLRLASGEWAFFLGSNDQLASEVVLEEMVGGDNGTADLLIGNVRNVNSVHSRIPEIHIGSFDRKIVYLNTVHHQGVLYRRTSIMDIGFNTDYKVLADYDLNLKLWLEGRSAVNTGVLVSVCDASGTSKQFVQDLYSEELRIKRSHFRGMQRLIQPIWVRMKYLWKNS